MPRRKTRKSEGLPSAERRTFRPDEIEAQWRGLREDFRLHQESRFLRVDEVKGDTARFFREICRLKPFWYQLELAELYRKNQFLAVRWPRQTGKSTSIGVLLLQDAYENDDLNVAFIGPSFRQTKLNLQRIAGFCRNLPSGSCHIQRTRISFRKGSYIEAFPNNADTIRGNTFHCLPGYVKVFLSEGSQLPISELKVGQKVLSYNLSKCRVEAKKVTHVFRNPLGSRQMVRVFHDFGHLDCTEDHKIYTLQAGFVEAARLPDQSRGYYLHAYEDSFDCKNEKEHLKIPLSDRALQFTETAYVLQSSLQAEKTVSTKEQILYDIEVEDNHNFFADGLIVSNCIFWDEVNFTSCDEDLYDAILFTLGTTNGKLIASSTPFSSDSMFWRMCNHKDFSDFARHHFSFEKALSPNGPLYPEVIKKIHRQFGDDPSRWRREMEAEWAEDEDVWLPQSLIVSCIGTKRTCDEDLEEYDPHKSYDGEFFLGLDIGQVRDFTSLSVVERVNDVLFLRLQMLFPHPTAHAHVLGFIKRLQDQWGGFEKIRVDFTREGPSLIKDMEYAGVENAEGVNFSIPRKSEMANLLKQRMMNQQLRIPLLSWENPYRGDICTELNVEKYQLRKDGNIAFSHRSGTHDDVFWSIALAVYGTVEMEPEPFLALLPR